MVLANKTDSRNDCVAAAVAWDRVVGRGAKADTTIGWVLRWNLGVNAAAIHSQAVGDEILMVALSVLFFQVYDAVVEGSSIIPSAPVMVVGVFFVLVIIFSLWVSRRQWQTVSH